jgi:hypothetical protein
MTEESDSVLSSIENQETKRKPEETPENENSKKSKLEEMLKQEELPILSPSVLDPVENARLERLWRSTLEKSTKKRFEEKEWSKKKGSKDAAALEKENGESKEDVSPPQESINKDESATAADAEPKAPKKPKKRVYLSTIICRNSQLIEKIGCDVHVVFWNWISRHANVRLSLRLIG